LQTDQAAADTRMAQAQAEGRRAEAIALQQEMKAKVTESRAMLVLAEAKIPRAIALAFRAGQFYAKRSPICHSELLAPTPAPASRVVRATFPLDESPLHCDIDAWETEGGACS
jgi:hypothetical protein